MAPVRDHHVVSPCELPHGEHLRATENLLKNSRVMSGFRGYPHDPGCLLDGLVPGIHVFFERNNAGRLHVCKDCYKSLSNNRIPETALADGFQVGDRPRKFDAATVIERAAVYAVRVKGHVIALESRRVRSC